MTLARKVWAGFIILYVVSSLASLPADGATAFGVVVGTLIGGWLMYALPVLVGSGAVEFWRGWRGPAE